MFNVFKWFLEPKDKTIKKEADSRKILGRISDDEKKELDDITLEVDVFGTYDFMESNEANDICSDIAKLKEDERKKRCNELLEKYGFDPQIHCVWSDGVITEIPDSETSDMLRDKDIERRNKMSQRQYDAIQKIKSQEK